MPGGHKNIKPEDGRRFSSTYQPKKNGRKKKIYTVVKELGYSVEDLKTAFKELAFYTLPELKKVYDDDSKPVIVRIVANQLFSALKKDDWTKIKDIIEHIAGKPSQHVTQESEDLIIMRI